jgi:hypothetical protein
MTARIRWELTEYGSFTGYAGPESWLFQIWKPDRNGTMWALDSELPGQQQRHLRSDGPDAPEELKADAEHWLEEHVSLLGASFPAEPGDPFANIPGTGHDLDDFAEGCRVRYSYPGNGYLSGREEAAELLTEGEVYTVTQRMAGTSVTYLELQGVEGHFNSVMFEPVPLEENLSEEEAGS